MGKLFYSLFISTFIIIFSYAASSTMSGTSVQGTATQGIISTQSESSVGGTTNSESGSQSQQAEEIQNSETQQEIENLKEQYIQKEVQGISTQVSDIESLYMSKIGLSKVKGRLRQFGYNFFKGYKVTGLTSVGDKYILGPGDFLLLYIWGDPVDILGLNGFYRLVIDREGKVFIPHLGVFYVWGLSVAKAKNLFYDFFKKKFKNFQIELSLGKLRTFPVYVSGFVNKPSVVQVTGINTVLDALALAGGISKNGSLRNIILRRATGEKQKIDLYDLLVEGKPINITVKQGDSIYVGPIGKTAAIYGEVKRPAIYELKENATINDLIKLAGGLNPSAYEYNVKLYRYENNQLIIKDGSLKDKKFMESYIKDGDLIKIEEIKNIIENKVEIKGHIKYPSIYSINEVNTLRKAIKLAGFLDDTNLYYAEIIRKQKSGNYKVIEFKPIDILNNKKDIKLKPLDTVVFYPEFIYKPIKISGEIK
ncbi:SLBB domain-containing protein [Hydrogenothermus marinus]|uniref:SLBB domain-containing protein n=1 Tax=Hydrogenothermus marinus TaxID=133270 RepID=UPI000EFA2146|nr:SLBB domain-containing protein [Hydrogenothermus marinus]